MFLIDHAATVLPATSEPAREEDPFSLMLYDLFKPRYEKVCAQRGKDTRIAMVLASVFGGWTFCDPQVHILMNRGPNRVSAFLSVAWFPAAPQGRITIKEQLRVPASTCSAEFYAFYDALSICRFWLEHDVCDVAFAGAAETVGSPFMSKAYGPSVTHDSAVLFVLAREGDEIVRLHEGLPPSNIVTTEWQDETVMGVPMRGSSALPLLLLKARGERPCGIRVPARTVVHANSEGLDLWRQDLQ